MGFYKKVDDDILKGEKCIFSPVVTLKAEDKDSYTYPQDGWYWFDTFDEALVFFADMGSNNNDSITPLQAELQLLEIGKLDNVLELLKLNREASIYWNRASKFYRNDAILLSMAQALDISSEDLDNLFIQAKSK